MTEGWEKAICRDTYFSHSDLTFVWDESKNEINIKKHHISFYVAAAVFDDLQRIEFSDISHSEDEDNPAIDPEGTPELYAAMMEAVAERNRRVSRKLREA